MACENGAGDFSDFGGGGAYCSCGGTGDTAVAGGKIEGMAGVLDATAASCKKDASYRGLWTVSFILKEF